MSAALHAQLAAVMEVLANAAVAEICELVDGGYSLLQLEISRSRKENEALRRKLRLVELRAARATALRAAFAASGTALPQACGRARPQTPARHPGNAPRANRAAAGAALVPQELVPRDLVPQELVPPELVPRDLVPQELVPRDLVPRDLVPPELVPRDLVPRDLVPQEPLPDSGQETSPPASVNLTMAVIKVEDDSEDESWSQCERNTGFCRDADEQKTEPSHPPTQQEVAGEGQTPPNTSGYECLMYEPQVQHGPHTTHNPLGENPGCSYVLNTSESSVSDSGAGGGFPFNASDASPSAAFIEHQQRAPLAADEPRHPVRRAALIRRDGWRHQGGLNRAAVQSEEDGGGKSFVCNCCGKSLACLKNLKTHMRVHTGEKPFVCSLCGKRFSDSSNLKRHQSVHTGEKRYGCVHCGKRFAQSGSLKVHMTVHTDCKQFRCSTCGKTFISGSHLRRHIAVHAGQKRVAPTLQGQ